jgi:poly(3-hydroxybutyrate) depolymerase
MVKLIEEDLGVDTTRLFALGFSYGGGMSYAIACARATVSVRLKRTFTRR